MENIITQILNNHIFKSELVKIDEYEKDRIYCGHGLEHLLAVCRLAYIDILVNVGPVTMEAEKIKDLIYAAGLLHDIGRAREYETKTPHEIASQKLAGEILRECNYPEKYINIVLMAIDQHRLSGEKNSDKNTDKNSEGNFVKEDELSEISDIISKAIKVADKKSRNCFDCKAAGSCYWPEEKKNKTDDIFI